MRGQPGPYAASVAHQAAGIVLREFGDLDTGIGELRKAFRLARRTGVVKREADVLASLAVALVYAGRTAAGLAAFDRALRLSKGAQAGQVLLRRSVALLALGQHEAALDDARRAVALLRRTGDKVWTARVVGHRGLMYLHAGIRPPARMLISPPRDVCSPKRARCWNPFIWCTIARWSPLHSMTIPTALAHLTRPPPVTNR